MSSAKGDELLAILKRGGSYPIPELCDELDLEEGKVRWLIARARKLAVAAKGPWIHSTGAGYSLTTTPAEIIKEANMRLKMCVGLYVNSAPVFGKAQKIAASQFEKLKIEHRPTLLKLGKL